jgi:hypothetical protein
VKYAAELATVALCAGLAINQFRDKPVPLAYLSKHFGNQTKKLPDAVY